MASMNELDILSKLLNPENKEDEVLQSIGDPASFPIRNEPSDINEEAQVAATNNIVEAQNAPELDRQVASKIDTPESAPAPKLSKQEELLKQLKEMQSGREQSLKEARSKDDKQRLIQSIISAIPSLYAGGAAQKSGVFAAPTKIQPIKPMGEERALKDAESRYQDILQQYKIAKDGGEGLTPYQKEILGLKKDELELKKQKQEDKPAEPTFEEKERTKAEIKQKLSDEKVRKKEVSTTKESIKNVDDQLEKVRRAKQLMKDLAEKGTISDTGPIDQYITGATTKGQKLRQAFNDLALEKMTKMFKGMSKAIDSDAERKMFEQSQASLSNYPSVNMEILDNMEKALESTKQKNIRYMKEDLEGNSPQSQGMNAPHGEEVERNGKVYKWNPSVGKYQLK